MVGSSYISKATYSPLDNASEYEILSMSLVYMCCDGLVLIRGIITLILIILHVPCQIGVCTCSVLYSQKNSTHSSKYSSHGVPISCVTVTGLRLASLRI